jgi:hypothetical protein
MKRAVRNIIKTRAGFNPKQAHKLICKVEKRHSDDSNYNECQDNAFLEQKKNPNVTICAGWLVSAWNPELEEASAVYHYWNHDNSTDTYYDTTPMRDKEYEYETYIHDNVIHDTWYSAEKNDKSVMRDKDGNHWMFPALICHKDDRVEFSMMRNDAEKEIRFDVDDLTERGVKDICRNLEHTFASM